jgi:hypothetical protein
MSFVRLIASIFLSVILASCAAKTANISMVHEDARGSIFVEELQDTDLRATHPQNLELATLRRVLQGVIVQPRQGTLTTLVFGESRKLRAFSDEEIDYLSPFLLHGLAQAGPSQAVGFVLRHGTRFGPLETRGSFLAVDSSLLLRVSEFRYQRATGTTDGGRGRMVSDTNGLDQRVLAFQPDVALRDDIEATLRIPGPRNQATLIVDYRRLARLPDSQPTEGNSGSPSGQLESASEAPKTPSAGTSAGAQNGEIDRLKAQVRDLERQLENEKRRNITP